VPLSPNGSWKVSDWARRNGIARRTAWQWWKAGKLVVVVDPEEVKDDRVQDRIGVRTGMGARLYGRRSARQRAQRAVQAGSKA
jgi:predicted site-specific integrase-resolvase